MTRSLKLRRDDAALLVVDVQERLVPAMSEARRDAVVKNVARLAEGARALGVPVIATEQYPKGLGPTIPEVKAALGPSVEPVAKTDFSCTSLPEVAKALAGRKQVVVVGMETHVCVYQTARDLAEQGYQVFVPEDAVASRTEANVRVGMSLVERAGAIPTSTEAVLFDLVGKAGTPEFKVVSGLVK